MPVFAAAACLPQPQAGIRRQSITSTTAVRFQFNSSPFPIQHHCRHHRRRRTAAPATAPRAMLLEHLPALEGKRIVLASASPRRRELLSQMGLKFEVVVSSFEETLPKEQYSAADYARMTATHKALDVAQLVVQQAAAAPAAAPAAGAAGAQQQPQQPQQQQQQPGMPVLVIGADTVVEYGEHILEKPADAEEAGRVLRMLSGRRHHVHTGVALVMPAADGEAEPHVHSFAVTTTVEFDELSSEAIQAYIASGEPFDKAGSYGIQGLAGSFVRGIEGCFFNVVGFPVHRFGVELAQLIQGGQLRL
ncbi:hypothetical protein ABPG75_007134 [Micractinium tetrahymenae]